MRRHGTVVVMVGGTLRFVRQKLGASDWFAPVLFFSIVGMIILGPALKPGFIFLLDMPWPQHFQLSDYAAGHSAHYPLIVLLTILNKFIAAWLLQKMVILFAILLAGMGMYRLQRHLHASRSGRYAAGLLYAYNPYVLERLVAGQWLVLLGYALFPVFVLAIMRFGKEPTKRYGLRLLVVYGLYPIVSLHWWYMATLCTAPFALRWLIIRYKSSSKKRLRFRLPTYWQALAVISAALILLNLRWLAQITGGDSKLQHISTADFQAFATDGSGLFGAIINVISLYGFWQTAVTLPREVEINAWLLPLLLVGVTILGVYHWYTKLDKRSMYLAIVGVVAIVLAAGFGSSLTMPFTSVVIRLLPGYVGMRDTAKWVGVIVFVYAWFLPAGLVVVRQQLHKLWAVLGKLAWVNVSFAAVYIVLMLGGLWGVNAQLHAYWYPNGWAEAQTLLQVRGATKIMVVPWRGYMHLHFANQAYMANPAKAYFTPEVIQGSSANNLVLDETRSNPAFDTIANTLHGGHMPAAFALMRQQGIDHLVLLKTADWQAYANQLIDVQPLYEDSSIAVYGL